MSKHEEVIKLLSAIGDPVRLEIIFLLSKNKPRNVGEIASQFHVSRPAISHHLKVLKDARILLVEKKGQESYYILNRKQAITSLRALADLLDAETPAEES